MRKTIRKVTIVVPVLMTSCQVSEKPKRGPVAAQIRTMPRARKNVQAEPTTSDVTCANLRKNSFMVPLCDECPTRRRGLEHPPVSAMIPLSGVKHIPMDFCLFPARTAEGRNKKTGGDAAASAQASHLRERRGDAMPAE